MITDRELGWAAGFIEGEGCFHGPGRNRGVVITVGQVQREPLERLQSFFGGRIYLLKAKLLTHHPASSWQLAGHQAIRLAMTLFPLMSPKRKERIRAVLAHWKGHLPATQYRKAGTPKKGCKVCAQPVWNIGWRLDKGSNKIKKIETPNVLLVGNILPQPIKQTGVVYATIRS